MSWKRSRAEFQQEREPYDEVMKFATNNADAYEVRGLARLKARDSLGAMEDFDKAIRTEAGRLASHNISNAV